MIDINLVFEIAPQKEISEKIIGPYFFEDNDGKAVFNNSGRYRAMLSDFLASQVHELGVEDLYFQQDGAPCHTSSATIASLLQMFPGCLTSKFDDITWPPRSPDLTPSDFFLWGYFKSKVYINRPQSLAALKVNIQEEITNISAETLRHVMKSVQNRASACINAKGGHLPEFFAHRQEKLY